MCGIRNLRVLYGPLPLVICQAHFKMTQACITFAIMIVIGITLARFVFICVWGSMKPIKDDFCARVALNQATLMCALHTWCWPTNNLDVSHHYSNIIWFKGTCLIQYWGHYFSSNLQTFHLYYNFPTSVCLSIQTPSFLDGFQI